MNHELRPFKASLDSRLCLGKTRADSMRRLDLLVSEYWYRDCLVVIWKYLEVFGNDGEETRCSEA